MPRLLELCCGSKSFSRHFLAQGWEVVSVDIDPKFQPTIVSDVRLLEPTRWPAGHFDVVFASPPCCAYSIARNTVPRDFREADEIVLACWDHIKHQTSDPEKQVTWFMENPGTGYLKTRPFQIQWAEYIKPVTYCKYGKPYRKLTYFWTNLDWEPKPLCSKGARCVSYCNDQNCHIHTAQKGPSKIQKGTNKTQNDDFKSEELYSYPERLVAEILACISGRRLR